MIVRWWHGSCVHPRRVTVLSEQIARLVTNDSRLLDVGCGDGRIAKMVQQIVPSLSVEGLEVLVRPDCQITSRAFDGVRIPHADRSFDFVLLVDVLHHSNEAEKLLDEARRVARRGVIVKDHLLEGRFAYSTLSLMDWVGNARFGVALPRNYWSRSRWIDAFDRLGLTVDSWRESLHLYPVPLDLVCGRSLHFLARLHTS